MNRFLLLLLAFCISLPAQTSDRPYTIRSWFPDGTGLEIYTEATGPTHSRSPQQESTEGMMGIAYDRVDRFVMDKDKNVLFGYYLEAHRASAPGAVFIQIAPLDPRVRTGKSNDHVKYPAQFVPTVDTIREFPAVKIGEVVTLEILFNPSTGEKVYDVIRPFTDPAPHPNRPVVTAIATRDQFSLKEIALRVNGQPIDAPSSWMIGAAARIDVPGQGTFILSAYDPRNPLFHSEAKAELNVLSWAVDGKRVEVTSKTNILDHAGPSSIWIYHDPNHKSPTVELQTADTVDWLLPRK